MSSFQTMNKVVAVSRGLHSYEEYDANTIYYEFVFGFAASKIYVVNDSDNYTAQISFNGTTLHGELKPHEPITLLANDATSIYGRVTDATGTNNIRVFAT